MFHRVSTVHHEFMWRSLFFCSIARLIFLRRHDVFDECLRAPSMYAYLLGILVVWVLLFSASHSYYSWTYCLEWETLVVVPLVVSIFSPLVYTLVNKSIYQRMSGLERWYLLAISIACLLVGVVEHTRDRLHNDDSADHDGRRLFNGYSGHATWHVLASITLFTTYEYLYRERYWPSQNQSDDSSLVPKRRTRKSIKQKILCSPRNKQYFAL